MTDQEWHEWHDYYIFTDSAKRWQAIQKSFNAFKGFIDAQVREKRYQCEDSVIHGDAELNAHDEAEFERIKKIQILLTGLEITLNDDIETYCTNLPSKPIKKEN